MHTHTHTHLFPAAALFYCESLWVYAPAESWICTMPNHLPHFLSLAVWSLLPLLPKALLCKHLHECVCAREFPCWVRFYAPWWRLLVILHEELMDWHCPLEGPDGVTENTFFHTHMQKDKGRMKDQGFSGCFLYMLSQKRAVWVWGKLLCFSACFKEWLHILFSSFPLFLAPEMISSTLLLAVIFVWFPHFQFLKWWGEAKGAQHPSCSTVASAITCDRLFTCWVMHEPFGGCLVKADALSTGLLGENNTVFNSVSQFAQSSGLQKIKKQCNMRKR